MVFQCRTNHVTKSWLSLEVCSSPNFRPKKSIVKAFCCVSIQLTANRDLFDSVFVSLPGWTGKIHNRLRHTLANRQIFTATYTHTHTVVLLEPTTKWEGLVLTFRAIRFRILDQKNVILWSCGLIGVQVLLFRTHPHTYRFLSILLSLIKCWM